MSVNLLAVLVAAISSFVIGGLWYGPLFGKMWQKEVGLSDADLAKSNMAMIFGISFLMALVVTLNLAYFVGAGDVTFSVMASLATGIGFIAPAFAMVYAFERKTLKHFLINAGYWTISLVVMGLIIGYWK